MLHRLKIVLSIITGLAISAISQAEPVMIDSDVTTVSLGEQVKYLEDPDSKLELTEFLDKAKSSELTSATAETIGLGFTSSTYWFMVTLESVKDSPKDLLLEINYPLLDRIHVFQIKNDKVVKENILGDRLDYKSRPIDHRNFLLPISLNQPTTIVLKVKTSSSFKLGLLVHDEAYFWEKDSKESTVQGLYFGIMIVMIIYNIFIYLTIRTHSYLFYVIYVANTTILQLGFLGYDYQYLWPQSPWIHEKSFVLSLGLASWAFLNFTYYFLSLGKNESIIGLFIKLVAYVSLGLGILSIFVPYAFSVKVLSLVVVIEAVLMMTAGIICLRQGSMEARYYLVAVSLFLLGITLLSLSNFAILPVVFVTAYGMQIGSASEVVLLSLALARRMKRLQEENAAIQKEAAESLQIKVEQRTRDLNLKTLEAERIKEESVALRIEAEKSKEESDQAHLESEQLRQKAEQQAIQLQEADQQKTNFFQNISHELRTPLTLILNPLENLHKRIPDDKDALVATKNSRRLLRLVNQLLDFQKLEAGKKELKLAPLNLTHFLKVCGEYFAAACHHKNITFLVTQDGQDLAGDVDSLWVMAEIDAMEKITFNYLSNALKYTPSGGTIELGLQARDTKVRLLVKDSGAGIAKEDQAKLFQLFSQVDGSATRSHEGTGLGLALVKSLVHKMEGEVGLDSQPARGSTFWAELDIMGTAKPVVQVLIVEDDQVLRQTILDGLLDILDFEDHEIQVKDSVEEALIFLEQHAVSCLISDYNLVGRNGLDLMEEVIKCDPSTFRVLITGDMNFELLERGSNEHLVDQFFHKNDNSETFIPKLAEVIAEHTVSSSQLVEPVKPLIDMLMVEDDQQLSKSLLAFIVENAGIEAKSIEAVSTADAASDFLKKHLVRCVLSDYNLGSRNGLDLLEDVAQKYPETSRVLMTAEADLVILERALNNGAVDHVVYKPLDQDKLIITLTDLISNSTLETTALLDDNFQIKPWVLTDEDADSLESPAPFAETQAAGEAELILVVDDLPDMRDLIAGALTQQNYRVALAANGQQGLDLVEKLRPDLVITDWMMPEMSGPDLIQAMAREQQLAAIPSILLTAKSDEESRIAASTIGATAFLGKPFSEVELQSQVANLINLRKQERLAAHRQAADLRVELVGNLAHRINNPMHLILGLKGVMAGTLENIHSRLTMMLSEGEEAQEAMAVFDHDIKSLEKNISWVMESIDRSQESLQEIYSISGIEGVQFSVIKLGDLFTKLKSRLESLLGEEQAAAISMDIKDTDQQELVSNHFVLLVAFEKLFKVLLKSDVAELGLKISSVLSVDCQRLEIRIRGNQTFVDRFTKEEIEMVHLLLEPYQVSLLIEDLEQCGAIVLGIPTDASLLKQAAA